MTNELETAWAAQEPSPDFAARVVERALRDERRRTLRRYAIAAGGLAAAAALVIVLLVAGGRDAHGDVTARERIEVAIGERAVAVLEPGAHVRWRGDIVEQTRGDVFYRVERGASFTVRTPSADAVVLGTCFRISINEERGAMKKRDVSAGAIGAVVAAVVVVGVYEGKVRVSRADQAVTVRAGESATADSTGVRSGAGTTPAVVTAAREPAAGSAHDEAELRQRLADLELEKAALEQALSTLPDGGKSPYDLAPEDWAKLAEKGEFRYQYPCFQKGGFRPSAEQLARLGLQPSDADAIQQAYRHSNERFNTSMRSICTDLGATKNGDADLSGCLTQIFQNLYTQPGGAKPTFTQLAEIRAGKRPMPAPEAMSAEMRMLLAFSGGMEPFEAELAKTFGAEEAHRIAYSEELCFQAQTL